MQFRHFILTFLTLSFLAGQSAVDLKTQSKNVDFSGAVSTRPWRMGTSLPATCADGEAFFQSNAPAGQNVSICAGGQWRAYTGTLPPQSPSPGLYLRTDGANVAWSNVITGGSGLFDCASIPGVCDIMTALVPQKALENIWTGANDFSASPFLKATRGDGDPSSGCSQPVDVGKIYVRGNGTPDNNLWICENNSGLPRWRRPQDGAAAGLSLTDAGHYWLSQQPASDDQAPVFVPRQPVCFEFTNQWPNTRLSKAWAMLGTADTSGFAAAALYNSTGALVSSSSTISTDNTGPRSFNFSPALTLTQASYSICVASTSATARFHTAGISSSAMMILRGLTVPRVFHATNSVTGTNPLVWPAVLGSRSTAPSPSIVAVLGEP